MRYYFYCNQKNISIHHQQAIEEFRKRLSSYCESDIIVTSHLKFKDIISSNNHQIIYISNGPSTYSSEEFASYVNRLQQSGKSNVHILIGYSQEALYEALPIDSPLLPACDISITRNAMSAETMTVLLYEQLYRAYTILQGKTYHK